MTLTSRAENRQVNNGGRRAADDRAQIRHSAGELIFPRSATVTRRISLYFYFRRLRRVPYSFQYARHNTQPGTVIPFPSCRATSFYRVDLQKLAP